MLVPKSECPFIWQFHSINKVGNVQGHGPRPCAECWMHWHANFPATSAARKACHFLYKCCLQGAGPAASTWYKSVWKEARDAVRADCRSRQQIVIISLQAAVPEAFYIKGSLPSWASSALNLTLCIQIWWYGTLCVQIGFSTKKFRYYYLIFRLWLPYHCHAWITQNRQKMVMVKKIRLLLNWSSTITVIIRPRDSPQETNR